MRSDIPTVSTAAKVRWTAGYYYTSNDNARSTFALTLDKLYLIPLDTPASASFDRIGVEVTTAGAAGALLRLGVYTANSGGLPTTLLSDFGTVDSATTGNKELTVSRALSDTTAWLAVACQVATCSVRTLGSAPDRRIPTNSLANIFGGNALNALTYSSVSGALPSSLTAASLGYATQGPLIVVRAA